MPRSGGYSYKLYLSPTLTWAPPHLTFFVAEIARSARRIAEGVEDLPMTHTTDQRVLHRRSS